MIDSLMNAVVIEWSGKVRVIDSDKVAAARLRKEPIDPRTRVGHIVIVKLSKNQDFRLGLLRVARI
jgi:hypothetical protein